MAPQNQFDALVAESGQPAAKPAAPSNPFDELVREPVEGQEQQMRAARLDASKTSPERRAESLRLATKTGLPVDTIERNFDELNRRLATEQHPYQQVQQQAPALAAWSTDPNNAAIAYDDTENLGALEWVLKAPGRAFAQQLNSLRYSELRVKSMFRPLTREETDAMNSYQYQASVGGDLGVKDSFFKKAITGAGRLLAQSVEPSKYALVGGLEVGAAGAAAGSVLPGVGTVTGAVSGFGVGARAGMMYGVFKSTAMQEAAGAYDELMQVKDETGKTIDPGIARVAALTVGGLNGLVEQVGLEAFVKRFPGLDKIGRGFGKDAIKIALQNPTVRAGFARIAKEYVGGLSTEVATEIAQRGITIAGEELAKVAAGDTFKSTRKSPGEVWDSLIMEGIQAVPEFSLGMLPGPMVEFAHDIGRAKRAEQGVAFFNALHEGVAQTKTAERMPAAFQQLVDSAVKDGPVKEVFAPTDTWTTYWQGQGLDPAAVAAEVTGRPDALEKAQQSGNLTIPTARYASMLAGTEHAAAFANELRLGTADAMNGREMEEFRAGIEETKQRVMDAAKKEAADQGVQDIRQQVEQQLVERGNVPRETAATMAQALTGIAVTAKRAGFEPSDVFQTYGLTVERRASEPDNPAPGGGTASQAAQPLTLTHEEIPGLAALEASVGGASIEGVDAPTGLTLNASGDSAASLEALSRQEGMQSRGEAFVVYDRAGRRRALLGPEAVDYKARTGETYGVEGPDGFKPLDDQGGRLPSRPALQSRLGENLRSIFGDQPKQPFLTGARVEGASGPANHAGVSAKFIGYQAGTGDVATQAAYSVQGGERNGHVVSADDLRAMGVDVPTTPAPLEFFQRQLATEPALRAWFGASAVVDDEGQPLVVYHGTTQTFSTFDRERANPESDFGAGFYFSNNPDDVAANYAGIGGDLKNKIDKRAEQLAQEQDKDYNDPAIVKQATAEFVQHPGFTVPVFLKIENPIVVGGEHETRLTYDLVEDPDTGDITDEKGTLLDFIAALRDVASGFHDTDGVEDGIAKLLDLGLDGGISANGAINALRDSETFGYITDDTGNLVSTEVIRLALMQVGFDGIIDNNVDVKFGSQRRIGQKMAGMNADTVHYIVFEPTQIKSAISNRGTFDPIDPNILFQAAADPLPASMAFYSRLDRAVQESKQAKASGAQWKAQIKNAKIGINRDEFAIAKLDDLEDGETYTRDEVQAYLKQNRPQVSAVVLAGPSFTDDDVEERAREIVEQMSDAAMDDVDWSEYLGEAAATEDEIEVEREKLDDNGDAVLDEDGDPVMEYVTETRYYPAIEGGMVKRRRGYGLEHRRGTETIENSDSYDDESDAIDAAQKHIDDMDRDAFHDYVYESVRDGIDYGEAEREAREQLEKEGGGTGGGVRYAEYVLEPEAETESYREVFLTAGEIKKPVGQAADRETVAANIYSRSFSDLDETEQAHVDRVRLQDTQDEHGQPLKASVYKWNDGHDLYDDIENPIVRIRLNVRPTMTLTEPRELNQAIMEAGIRAVDLVRDLRIKYKADTDLGRTLVQSLNEPDLTAYQNAINDQARAEDEMKSARGKRVPGDRVLFLEEVQPPRPEQQPKMAPIFLKNWRELAFKWALRYAAEEGLGAVAWTTGEQQAERYSLEKKVHKIDFIPSLEDSPSHNAGIRQTVHLDLKDSPMLVLQIDEGGVVQNVGNNFRGRWEQLVGQPLSAIIGPELSDQIVGKGTGTIEGKGLKVGGEGLKRLYDYDFKNIANALPALKKNGIKVSTVPLEVNRELRTEYKHGVDVYQVSDLSGEVLFETPSSVAAETWKRENRMSITAQPAIVLTPELRAAVMGGQALFQGDRYRPVTSSELETLNQQLDAVVAKAQIDEPGAMSAHVASSGEVVVGDGSSAKILPSVIAWADEHNMQVSMNDEPSRGLGFVRNGTAEFYDPASQGAWVRPSSRAMQQAPNTRGPRGAIRFDANRKTTITLFEHADLSTFLHETGHFYLEVMGDLVDRLTALDITTLTPQQQQVRADYQTILRSLGIETRGEIEREHHEQFARMFESYLMEGKAPSIGLRDAFGRFRAWMLGVYRSLRALNAPLTDDVRRVFDRMLATDDAIAEAEQAGKVAPMFLTPEQAGMSHERFALYRQAIEEASTSARERLERQTLDDVRREQTDQWKTREKEVRTEVERAVQSQPVYRAIAAMQKGTNPDGTPLTEGEAPAPIKLSKKMLVDQFGREVLTGLPKTLYSAEGGVDSGVVAEMYGFSSGHELINAVKAAQPIRNEILQETNRRMLSEHGSLLLDGTLHEKAQAAVADEARETVLREELRALARQQRDARPFEQAQAVEADRERAYERRWFEAEAKLRIAIAEGKKQAEIDVLSEQAKQAKRLTRTGPSIIRGALPSQQALRDAAQASIAGTKVRDLNPTLFWSAARRASQKAIEAAAQQNYDEAIRQKHQEVISLALYRETMRGKDDIAARVKMVQQLAKPQSMAKLKIAGETYHDQVAGVLDRFEFAPVAKAILDRRAALWKWVQGQEAQGLAVDLPEILLDEASRTNYQDLTVEELIGVTDGLKQIVHLSRLKNRLLKAEGRRQLNAAASTIADSIRSYSASREQTERDRRASTERNRLVQGVLASHRKLASLAREMDGFKDNGPVWNAIVRPLNDAGAREAEMNGEAGKRFGELIEEAYPRSQKRDLYKRTMVPAVGVSLSKMERLMIALNWGNDGNRDRIRRAEKWDDGQVQAVLDTLDERDAKFVQGVFNFIGSYWNEIASKQERVYGLRPQRVESLPFRIVDTEMKGGYFPLKYDDRLSASAAGQLDLEAANLAKQAAFTQATTKRGHTKERATTLDQPVRLDFGVMFEHVAQVIHDLSHHETLIDVGRLLGHRDVQQAIYETHGDIVYKAIKNTVRDVAFGDLPAVNAFEKALNHTRTGATVVGLGWSLTTAIMQPMGLANSIVRIGPEAVGRGVARWLGSPARMVATVDWIYEKSPVMKMRASTMQRELSEIRNRVGVYSGNLSGWVDEAISKTTFNQVTRQGIADSYFWFIEKMQQVVDVPTWLGAYDKAIREDNTEPDAIAIADQAVLDSQGGGQVKDLASVQRGGPAMKLFTNFYSYFNVLYNQAVESGKKGFARRDAAGVGRVAVDYMMLFIVPATLGYFVREGLKPGQGGDGDPKKLAKTLVGENLSYLMGTMVGLRELAGAVQGYYGYEGPAGARFFSAASKAIQQVKQGKVDEALLRTLNETAGTLFHYPAAQVWRTSQGISAIAEGKTKNPLAVLMGAPRESK